MTTRQKTDSFAAYAQGTYELSDATNLTLGIRHTSETKDFEGTQSVFLPSVAFTLPLIAVSDQTKEDKVTWRVALDHQLSDDVLVYASFNTGFKSGGYDFGSGGAVVSFRPEELDAFELGVKSEWLDRQVRVNAAVFYYDYTNLQLATFSDGVPVITNGDSADIFGMELEIDATLTERLSLNAAIALLDSEFNDFPIEPTVALATGGVGTGPAISAAGSSLPFSPEWTSSVGLNYQIPLSVGSLRFAADYFYSDGWFATEDNRLKQDSYSLVNASVNWYANSDETLSVRLWGKNLADTDYAMQMGSQEGFTDFVSMAPGRTFGATVGFNF
ncbi:MAG: TonB-dependent receptor [Pseudomonadales bacterium]